MPFKWRLKKTRKYDISTKNSFIVGVYLLDNAYLECTLSAESTGQECLKSIAQRIELSESQYFGLRYVTKKLHFHWVDLEKPLKKQLDKYAQPASHCHCLYFGVMFYVMGAHKIPDEVARYHYYLQLKNDVIDGRLLCSSDQAVRLAAYSLQAEFGDYEPEKYTIQNVLLFPKTMMKDETVAAELVSEAVAGHNSLQGVSPGRAELQYVKEIQMMDGYSVEYYSAKDESRKDLYLGTSCMGIFARYLDGQSPVYYKWHEIAKVTQSKKTLEIDTSKSSVQFQLEDTDTAKYVCHLSQLQRQFYKSSKGNLRDAQQVYIPPPTESTQTSQELGPSQTSLAHTTEQRYPPDVLQSSQQSLESSIEQQQHHHYHLPTSHRTAIEGDGVISNGFYQQQVMRHESLTPTPEGDPVYVNRAALLPAYRPSPDYDALMQQRLLQQHQQQQHQPQQHSHFKDFTPHIGAAQVYVHPDGMAYSQPEISQNIAMYRDEHGNYANVDALRNYSHSIYANIFQEGHGIYAGRGGDRGNNLAVHPTYSSPELNTDIHQQEIFASNEFSAQEAMVYHFRPPPPYPRTSSSTPDLAVQSNMVSDQPSTVIHGQKTSGQHDLLVQSRLDRSVDDLSGFKLTASGYSLNGHQFSFTSPEDSSQSVAVTIEGKTFNARDGNLDEGNTNVSAVAPDTNAVNVGVESTSKFLSEDQEDTSSEHSYSTFHAKESDESSEEENSRLKILRHREESNIHIRMFTPQEAPPPSKLKEEAALRESFRRLKIARNSSLNKDGVGFGRSSLRAIKDTADMSTLAPTPLNAVNEQLLEGDNKSNEAKPSSTALPSPPEMKELLDRLGDPPPYPGKTDEHGHSVTDTISTPNENCVVEDNTRNSLNQNKLSLTPKGSLGNVPLKTSPFRESFGSKPRSTSFTLDTIVPVSKPIIVCNSKDSDLCSSVLKSQSLDVASLTSDGFKYASEKDVSDRPTSSEDKDDSADKFVDLHDLSVGSDSDSDHERSLSESRHMGPLKLAAMNGLTLSRSMVLSMMNDETRAPTDDRRKMLESKISEGQVYAEFEQIPRKSDSLECSVASAAHNASRNRFKDVLPYDATRVKLTARKDNPDGYINASHIKLTANDNKWLFIATQAPLENTAVDFWQMIWENSIDVLAMLTPFQESGKSKCYVYWPQEPGAQYKQIYGEYEVELQFTDDSLCYLTSRIILRHGGCEHMVWHLQYTDWPDHGCPEDTYGFLGFLDEIESVARLAESESGCSERPPVVVHCSAGVGRTGVVLLTMVMKWCLEHNQNVDLPKALMAIRNQRMHMVQTMGQYRFIHDTLIQYLKNTRLI
ncbi:tyrosine-protein phosphatase non-receptor type 21-like isoform X2 [Biomphalaria glabrata]|uniref:protein-tyrosine-phosphatase n=1 Tax=Biomphalaria glabrata TaxID=6526 RepID=A0A9W2ZZN6_BIOGL|nr:tyrosine-protein phosphatase non-receptor type 21-like isoform X2 [Biomphalaria glabrata]